MFRQPVDREFVCRPEAVQEGRQLVARMLGDWELTAGAVADELPEDLLLVVSELMANAARSGAARVLLRVDPQESHVRVGVADDSPDSRGMVWLDPVVARCSRAIVAGLSERWGESFYDDELREVWSLLAIPPDGGVGRSQGLQR